MNPYYCFRSISLSELNKDVSEVITFTTGGNVTGRMAYFRGPYKVVFDFMRNGEEVKQVVYLTATKCNLGGWRQWFVCPSCGRRCGKLYIAKSFGCQKCYKILYASQSDWRNDGYLVKAQNIRRKLGGSVNMMEPFPDRPKGMHHKTYRKLHAQHYKAEQAHYRIMLAWCQARKAKYRKQQLDLINQLTPETASNNVGGNYFATDDLTPEKIIK